MVDGTFRSAPNRFCQVVVLHGFVFGRSTPLIYILLSNKSELSYKTALKKVNDLSSLNPKYIITDFERGLINSLGNVFKNSLQHGCVFHLRQIVWRRISGCGLAVLFKSNELVKKIIILVSLLTFIPVFKVEEYFEILKRYV
jgi:hypothetical protein